MSYFCPNAPRINRWSFFENKERYRTQVYQSSMVIFRKKKEHNLTRLFLPSRRLSPGGGEGVRAGVRPQDPLRADRPPPRRRALLVRRVRPRPEGARLEGQAHPARHVQGHVDVAVEERAGIRRRDEKVPGEVKENSQ